MLIFIIALLTVLGLAYHQRKVATRTVLRLTLDFKDIAEVKENNKKLKKYLSPELYKNYGINSEDFTYYNFSKLRNAESKTEIIEEFYTFNSSIIFFRIHNNFISSNRKFIIKCKIKGRRFDDIKIYEIAGQF